MSTPVLLASPGEPPITPPTHVLDFSDIGELSSAALSPDGSHLYVLVRGEAVDLGWVIAQLWPEWMGALAGLIALVLTILIVRRYRRPQIAGEPYCRRCNYNLSAQTGGQPCPECGLDLTKRPPVKGRRAWKRAWPFTTALALVLGAYGALWAFRVPRAAEWLRPDWTSTTALKWCDTRGLEWLKQFRQRGDVVIEVNAATGERQRTICTRSSMTYFQLVLTPDGSGFYLNRRASDGIDLVSIANGHVAASYVVAPNLGAPKGRSEFTYEIGGDAVVGHANDGSAVLSYWSDSKAIAYAVVWNPKTGKSVTIATTPAYVDQRGTNFCQGRQFIMAGRTDPVRVISTPLFMEAFPTQTYQMRWFGPDGSETRKVDLKTTVAPHGLSAVTPDGSLAFFSEQYGRSVIAIDLATGTQVGELDLAENTGSAELVATADGVRLLVAGFKWIGVRDIQRKAWTAFLQPPPTYYGARAITSPTPSRAAAVFQGNGKTKGAFTFVTAIWDIPPPAPSQGAKP